MKETESGKHEMRRATSRPGRIIRSRKRALDRIAVRHVVYITVIRVQLYNCSRTSSAVKFADILITTEALVWNKLFADWKMTNERE